MVQDPNSFVGGWHFGNARHLFGAEGHMHLESALPGTIFVVFSRPLGIGHRGKGYTEVSSTVA